LALVNGVVIVVAEAERLPGETIVTHER